MELFGGDHYGMKLEAEDLRIKVIPDCASGMELLQVLHVSP